MLIPRIFIALLFVLIAYHSTPVETLEYTPPSEINTANATKWNSTEVAGLEGINLTYENYQTWGHGIKVPDLLLVAYPKTSEEIIKIVNWAKTNGRKVRPRGHAHSFPPLTVTENMDPSKVILIDLMKHLTKISRETIPAEQTINGKPLEAVRVETGASWEELMTFCDKNNFALLHSIIIGDASVGGVLAIGAHGAVVPTKNENSVDGFSYGSLSNIILGLKAVVWDDFAKSYVLKEFQRSDPDAGAFLVHVGRALLTEVTLMVGPNYNVRCKGITDIPADELFAKPEDVTNTTRTFSSFLDETGRADVQWYQFTKNPWLKLWNVEPQKPKESFEVNGPYNYQFPVNVKDPTKSVPELGEIAYNNVVNGLASTNASDIWGHSKNILLYSNGSSTPIVYAGFVILTSRDKLQSTLSTVVNFYKDLNAEYANKTEYPIEYYIKFRATGLDNSSETLIKNAQNTLLSPLSIPEEYPHFNTALWMNTFTSRENPLGSQFMKRFEAFAFSTFDGPDGLARSEWSKSWAYTDDGAFLNTIMLKETIPRRYGKGFKSAIDIFNKYDPDRIFSNSFLDNLLEI